MTVAHWDEVEFHHPAKGEMDAEWQRLGTAAGTRDVGVNRGRVAPGKLPIFAAPTLVGDEALVVRLLERLEGAHHLAVRHHGLGRNAGLGLEFVLQVHIHVCLLVDRNELFCTHAWRQAARRDGSACGGVAKGSRKARITLTNNWLCPA